MGTGKSYKLMQILQELKSSPVKPYIVISDEGWNIEEEQYPNLRRYDNRKQFLDGFDSEPGGLHVIPDATEEEALEFTLDVAARSLAVYGPANAPPAVLYVDEMSGFESAQSGKFHHDKRLRKFLSARRHLHVGFLWGVQSPRMMHPLIAEWSTELYIFRMKGKGDAQFLRDATVPDEIIEKIPYLDDRKFIHYNPRTVYKKDGKTNAESDGE